MTARTEEVARRASRDASIPFRRALLKLSGEALLGDREYGIDPKTVVAISNEILAVHEAGTELAVVVGAERFEAPDGNVVAGYAHPPANKIGVLVELEGGSPELARRLAMHISFAAPEWTTRDDVPEETVAAERAIFLNSDEVQSKPEAAREKIVDGMLAKRFFAATPGGVLADQPWIHDPSKTVGQALAEAGASVAGFARISVAG